MAQMGFFDLANRYANRVTKKDPLVEIDTVVPWEEFRPTALLHKSCEGFIS
jgi:transposase, IS5 family